MSRCLSLPPDTQARLQMLQQLHGQATTSRSDSMSTSLGQVTDTRNSAHTDPTSSFNRPGGQF